MSGRTLRHCAGTIDKLSAIPGFRHETTIKGLLAEVDRFGFSIMPQSRELCPADALTYAVRDACGSVGSRELIAASIMSKKIAAGASTLVLDIKLGAGGLFESDKEAVATGEAMLAIARAFDLPTRVFYTDMSAPLGRAIGGASEMGEALCTLRDGRADELGTLAVELAVAMLSLPDVDQLAEKRARARIDDALTNGSAYGLLARWVEARGGDPATLETRLDSPRGLPVVAERDGWIASIAPQPLGFAAKTLKSADQISGDIILLKQVGDRVAAGDVVALVDDGTDDGAVCDSERIASVGQCFGYAAAAPPRLSRIRMMTSS